MKKDIGGVGTFHTLINWSCHLACIVVIIMAGYFPVLAQKTQEDTTIQKAETTKEPAQAGEGVEEETTIKTKMSLTADQYPDGTIMLNGLLRAKIKGAYQKVPNIKVDFYVVNAAGEETAIGDKLTDLDGIAKIKVNKAGLIKNEEGYYTFLARSIGNDRLVSSESDLMLHPAMLVMEPRQEDSTFLLKLHATSDSPDGPQPIVGAVVKVYVKRMFSSLKVGEGETDDDGMVEIEIPSGLPGDGEGNLQITAMIEETEEYGNLTTVMTQKWGYEVSSAYKESPKALWSPHPPTWMVITFFILMGAVWIHYGIIIYNLFRIKSYGSPTSEKT